MPLITYLALGYGVQSWTIAAMIALGELPPIDVAVHADTGHEATGTYDHARKWTPWLEQHGVNVVIVKPHDNAVLSTAWGTNDPDGHVQIPAFSQDKLDHSKQGQIPRQCTRYWKIQPIHRYIRTLLPQGQPKPESVHSWQGISWDEYHRVRTPDVQYIKNVYPLIELAPTRMTRADCIQWLNKHHLDVPPKSACVFCPFHRSSQWKQMKRDSGPDWDQAVEVDNLIRDVRRKHHLYIHSSKLPLAKAVDIPEDHGGTQMELDLLPCDSGMCFN